MKKVLANDYVFALLLLLIVPACFLLFWDFLLLSGLVIADGPDPDHPGRMIGIEPNLWMTLADILVISGFIVSFVIRKKSRMESA